MDRARRKELTQAYAERQRRQGVFAVRCRPTGETWVASTRNLDTHKNGVWFSLRHGGHPNKALQSAWREHGEEAFDYDVVEELSDEGMTRLGFTDLLKARERHWRETMGAKALVG